MQTNSVWLILIFSNNYYAQTIGNHQDSGVYILTLPSQLEYFKFLNLWSFIYVIIVSNTNLNKINYIVFQIPGCVLLSKPQVQTVHAGPRSTTDQTSSKCFYRYKYTSLFCCLCQDDLGSKIEFVLCPKIRQSSIQYAGLQGRWDE